jgi:putative glutamine amidotransferase
VKPLPKPRIAVPVPTSADLSYNERGYPRYAAAIEAAGGEAVAFPLTADAATQNQLATTCAGICLPGSPADVEPSLYGADRDPATAVADPAREATDYLLLTHAWQTGKPVLAICFGCQSLNVWRGGTLVQDLTPLPVNHAAGGAVAIAHSALVARDSVLGRLILADADAAQEIAAADDAFFRLPINTSHHQAVGIAGESLSVSARCPDDGVVECIELQAAPKDDVARSAEPDALGTNHFVLGIQWHPERSTEISATSRALFRRLVAEAERFAA